MTAKSLSGKPAAPGARFTSLRCRQEEARSAAFDAGRHGRPSAPDRPSSLGRRRRSAPSLNRPRLAGVDRERRQPALRHTRHRLSRGPAAAGTGAGGSGRDVRPRPLRTWTHSVQRARPETINALGRDSCHEAPMQDVRRLAAAGEPRRTSRPGAMSAKIPRLTAARVTAVVKPGGCLGG